MKHFQLPAVLLLLACILFTGRGYGQSVKLADGNPGVLSGVKKLNVEYDYGEMGVGKFATEAEYVEKKKADYNKDQPGKGDEWEKSWKADRKNRFQPQFEELFNKYGEPLQLGSYPSEKYTLIFRTTYTEPGFNIHVMRKNALINGEALIVETANKDKVLARIRVFKSPGRSFGGYDYDTGVRIQEAYAAAGKALGKFLKKQVK